jgi:hypothetical protein
MQENNKKNILFGKIKVRDAKNIVRIIDKAVFTENAPLYKKMPIIEVMDVKIVGQTNPPLPIKQL